MGRTAGNHLKEAARITADIKAQFGTSEVPVPLGFLFTVTISSGRFPLSFMGNYDPAKNGVNWTEPEVHMLIGDYNFLAGSLDIGENTGDIIAPIFACSDYMRCLVTDEAVVDLVRADEAPRGSGQVINDFFSRLA